MKARITKVSNNRPIPIVVPIWATTTMALTAIDIMVNANTRPAAVTTDPLPPMARMIVRCAMFGVFGLGILGYFVMRVNYTRKSTRVLELRGA